MANTLMKIMIALGLDTSEYEKGLGDTEKKTQSKTQQIAAGFSSVGASMMKVGGIMTATVTAPIVAGAMQSIEAASDLSETISKVGRVFGDNADEVLAFGENAATALGMSKNEALSAAGTFGNLFRAMGMTEDTSADMSTSLVQLAGDLASFNNMDPTEVLDKLRAGLSGESEPLKSLGVNLNEATIKAKAMQMGLTDASGTLSAAAKAQATYALILEQTTLAQGDFARTSDGLANQTRILKAQFADASAELGAKLLPIAIQLVGFLNQLLTAFTNLPAPVQNTILVIAGIAAAIGPLLVVIGSLMSAVGAITTFLAGPTVAAIGSVLASIAPVIAIIAAVIGVLALLYIAWKNNFLGIRDIVGAVIAYVVSRWQDLLSEVQAVWGWMNTVLFPFFQALANLFTAVVNLAIRELQEEWKKVQAALEPVYNFIKSNILPIFQQLGDFLGSTFGPIIQKAADAVRNVFGGAFEWVSQRIQELTSWIQKLADWINNLGGGGGGETTETEAQTVTPSGASTMGAGMSGQVSNTYHIYTSDNPGTISNAISLSELLGGTA